MTAVDVQDDRFEVISTHTPSWGVTTGLSPPMMRLRISTHTPSWGVTPMPNSPNISPDISTHTPSWGVTVECMPVFINRHNFYSHALVGRDSDTTHPYAINDNFYSHALVGRDRKIL